MANNEEESRPWNLGKGARRKWKRRWRQPEGEENIPSGSGEQWTDGDFALIGEAGKTLPEMGQERDHAEGEIPVDPGKREHQDGCGTIVWRSGETEGTYQVGSDMIRRLEEAIAG
jgi:hypothetical protein